MLNNGSRLHPSHYIQEVDRLPEAYAGLAQRLFEAWGQSSEVTRAQDVAEAVWRAANDPSSPFRIAAGADAVALAGSS
jgi:hypothetical protein